MKRAFTTGALATILLGTFGCAARLAREAPSSRGSVAGGDVAGWTALVEGRDDEAAARFRAELTRDPSNRWSRFGDASLAFERGDTTRALVSYLTLLELLAAGDARAGDEWSPLVAMAVGRLGTLLEELGGTETTRQSIEDRLAAVPTERLSWQARHGLAMITDQAARRRGDAAMLGRTARAAGCVRAFTLATPAGTLPHLDLDTPVAPLSRRPAVPPGRRVHGIGCVVSVPAFDGRPGAQRLFAEVEVPSASTYDVVVDFRGEARVIVDGAPAVPHGNAHAYGPRLSATRVTLTAGRHLLELRLAAFGGSPELSLMVVAARGPSPTDPAAREIVAAAPHRLARDLAETYVANRRGDAERTWPGAERLSAARRFAPGLALAAAVALDDPSRPANFARDQARGLLRAAVAVDPRLARARHALAGIALDDERPREAIEEAAAAVKAAPGWWPPELTLYAAYRLRGLTWDADQTLDRALAHAPGACSVIQTALGRAEDRHDIAEEKRLAALLGACGRDGDEQVERLRRTGDLVAAEAALRRAHALAPDRDETAMELAAVLLAQARAREAADLIAATIDASDGDGQVRLADALIAAGAMDQAKATVARAMTARPELPELTRVARALGLPLPLDAFRLDGAKVIRDFESSGRRYAAPAVVVLDRTVTRVFPSGAEMILTHEIVRVQSKDAIQKWGEIAVPDHTEVLVLRTHKADGTTREPEELAGKASISAADLAIGDYVEKEIVETRPPRDAFVVTPAPPGGATGAAPEGGFLGDRFYFQSFDAPLDRSEYVLVTGRGLAERLRFDRRAGAPEPIQAPVAAARASGSAPVGPESLVATTFAATQVPQLFAERSSVPSIEYVPSVRVASGVTWGAWTRFLREQLYGTLRASPALERAVAEIRALAKPGAAPQAVAAALVAWVGHNIEADDDLRDSASLGVIRGRGNRLAVILTLARLLNLPAEPVLARSLMTAEGSAPTPLEEADDFADPLVRFTFSARDVRYVDPRLKRAPIGYLGPGLDGARVLALGGGGFAIARSRIDEHRLVEIAVHLDNQGGGSAEAVETVRGWPALEWAEIVDRYGADPDKLRQDFEQRWLGVQFPGAVLKDLHIEIVGHGENAGPPQGEAQGSSHARPASQSPAPPSPASATASTKAALGEPLVRGAGMASWPAGPYAAGSARLRYTFSSSRLALKRDREIRFLPTFFRSQPGRRYATEPRRMTALLTGFDVPLDLRARVDLPTGARLVEPPRTAASAPPPPPPATLTAQPGHRFFWEDRRVDSRADAPQVLVIRRQSRFPIMRVPLGDYPAWAAELRRVDAQEQEEVRIGIAPEHP